MSYRSESHGAHKSFVSELLGTIADASSISGNRDAKRAKTSIDMLTEADQERVLDARFALGSDDGAYLRQNVVPLQTAEPGCDRHPLAGSLPSVDKAGRIGLMKAFETKILDDRQKYMDQFGDVVYFCAYLLSIEEVHTWIKTHLETEKTLSNTDSVQSRVLEIVNQLASRSADDAARLAQSVNDTTIPAMCMLMKTLLLLFSRPAEVVDLQVRTTYGPAGSGTGRLRDALEALAQTARHSEAAYQSNQVPLGPLRFRDATPDAQAANVGPDSTQFFLGLQGGAATGVILNDPSQAANSEDEEEQGPGVVSQAASWLMSHIRRSGVPSSGPVLVEDGSAQTGPPQQADGGVQTDPIPPPLPAPAPPPVPQPPPPPVPAPPAATYCGEITINFADPVQRQAATDALCAATSQLREDGGITTMVDRTHLRVAGINPFATAPRDRNLVRSSLLRDQWDETIWPSDAIPPFKQLAAMRAHRERLEASNDYILNRLDEDDEGTRALKYCVARGLCATRPPHLKKFRSDTDITLNYNVPNFPLPDTIFMATKSPAPFPSEKNAGKQVFGYATIATVDDYVLTSADLNTEVFSDSRGAAWAPVKAVQTAASAATNEYVYVMETEDKVYKATGEAVALEHLVDYYKLKVQAAPDNGSKMLAMACTAYTKLKQLQSLNVIYSSGRINRGFMSRHGNADPVAKTYFVTRPVLVCPGNKVLYPTDAGMFAMKAYPPSLAPQTAAIVPPVDGLIDVKALETRGAIEGGRERRIVRRDTSTAYLRAMLASDVDSEPPVYIAFPPGLNELRPSDVLPRPRREDGTFPRTSAALNLSVGTIADTLREGLNLCNNIDRLVVELDYVRAQQDDGTGPDDIARVRRNAVWDDSLREACIAGDRVYAFVRQLSGTISENVDAVCQIDEGMLVRQQQQLRERRARTSDRAAQEHMQLVRNVFGAVIRESGLTLGIEGNGAPGGGTLKVVSNTLRKQLKDVTEKGSGSEGFFSNSVRLEQLLTQGTGEMSLGELFNRLQEAGTALQAAAAGASNSDLPEANASLDFLSAPRNSLVLRYKPEALASLRQAFDTFQREMMQAHGRLWRTISAYELIEGNDEQLCTAFATFAAHILVHARMYSSATAMYVAAWPAAANAQQLKISLQRLVRVACNYLAHSNPPMFGIPNGRVNYFLQQPPPTGGSAPMMSAPRYGVQGGLWGLNMYGNR